MKESLCVIPVLVLLCFVVGCQDKAAMAELEKYKAQAAVEEQNIALHARSADAWRKRDISAWKEMVSPDFVFHYEIGRNDSLEKTIELMKQHNAAVERTSRDEDVFAKGDKVVVRYVIKHAFKEDVDGFQTKGKTVEGNGIEILRIANGKIAEIWDASDSLSLLEQIGYEVRPKEEKKK
jgi:ketosteroid isomerase-like protein